MSYFKNKVVWVTGASSGIGEALAKQLAKAGAKLILSARRTPELERVKKECGLDDQNGLVLPLDLADSNTMNQKVKEAVNHFDRIDVLINNGGISQRSLIVDTDISVYQKLMDINYIGTVALTKEVLKIFISQQSGQFAVVSSLMGKFASPLRSGYCGVKHALHGFFDALRLEHQKDNIKVTIVCPGYISTDVSMNALTGSGEKQQTMDEKTAKGLSPEKCAQQICTALARGKKEINIGGTETYAVYIKRFFPGLLDRIIGKVSVT